MRLVLPTCLLAAGFSLSAATSAQASWSSAFTAPPSGLGTDAYAPVLASYGGNLIVGGSFTRAGHLTQCGSIARFDGATWTGRLRRGMNGPVTALGTLGGDLYAGGLFTLAGLAQPGGAAPAVNVARWDGSTWSDLGAGVNDNPLAFATYGGELIVAGYFTEAGGARALRIASWDGADWSALGAGLGPPALQNTRVSALAVWNGALWAGGTFLEIDGTPVTGLARWDGSTWSDAGISVTFGTAFHAEGVEALAVYAGDLIVAGDIVAIDGVPVNGIARYDGSAWADLGAGLGFAAVRNLALYHGELVAVNGLTVGSSLEIGRWNGASWSGFGTGVGSWDLFGAPIRGVELEGRFYVGGNLARTGTQTASFLGQWTDPGTDAPTAALSDPSLTVSPNPFAGSARVRFALQRAGPVQLTAFDASGRRVARLVDELRGPGAHALDWPGRSDAGTRLPDGVYLLRLRTPEVERTVKVTLIRP